VHRNHSEEENRSEEGNHSKEENAIHTNKHADSDEEEEVKKGAAFKLKLVKAAEQGCCACGGHCDSSQVYCNQGKGFCEKCGCTWNDDFKPTDFGGSPHAWCAKGKMDSWRVPAAPEYMPAASSPLLIKVLTYNLEWWKVYMKKGGEGGREGHLVASSGPYDFIGLQECQNPWRLLGDGGLGDAYFAYQGGRGQDSVAVCAAYRKAAWEELAHGEEFVAEDGGGKGNYYGKRLAVWFRLKHRKTGEVVLFLVHHGPLPLSSGGLCGGHATGYNLLELMASKARTGDAIIFVGDFNAGPGSMTVQTVESQLTRVYSGWRFGGIDHIFTNLGGARVADKRNLGGAGSDHDALSVTLKLGEVSKKAVV